MRNFLLIVFLLQLLVPVLSGQEWIVPADKNGKLSTFPFDDNTRKTGEKLYSVNCISCHGTPGKGNFLKLVPPPADPATEKIQRNNDGELFFKVTTGRGQMPSFKNVLSSTDIWNIISYLRSFNTTYKQQVMAIITSSAYPGAVINIWLSYNNADSTIIMHASAISEKKSVPVIDAEAKLLVHRTFGMLQVDETRTTDKTGVAACRVPKDLPGDKDGNILVSARFTNEEVFGSVSKDTILCAATKTTTLSLVANRAMWNNVRKAPIWIILTYGLGLLSAWGFIFFVLMKLRDIYIIGDSLSSTNTENKS
jgi:mono/diheme cytochrome c family protein